MNERISKLMETNRWCYFIPPQPGDDGFIPALVIEGQSGYHMMTGNGPCAEPWYWGKTDKQANETCDWMNAKRGITLAQKLEIVLSSMMPVTA